MGCFTEIQDLFFFFVRTVYNRFSMRPLKGTVWKLTFSTLVSNKSWAASPLQGRDLLIGDFEGWSDQGPVTGGKMLDTFNDVIPVYTCTLNFGMCWNLDFYFIFIFFSKKCSFKSVKTCQSYQGRWWSCLCVTWQFWGRVQAIYILVKLSARWFLSHCAPDKTPFWKQCTGTNSYNQSIN